MADNTLSEDENIALGSGGCHFENHLGKGSFGKVVCATHRVDKRSYAVKMLNVCKDQIKYQRRELGLLTQLLDSNVIRYFHSWVFAKGDKQILCIQMELCGWNLSQLLQSNPLNVKKRCFYQHIFPQILNGLDAIHRIGWVHRDIHPGNILIANPKPNCIFRDTVIKIADFGLARHIDVASSMKLSDKPTLDKLSPNVGHYLFRAPEMSGDIYDNKVDLFSAGIVLYMLSCYLEVTAVKQWEAMWEEEILALRAGKLPLDGTNLCHKDQLLVNLLTDLLKQDPAERPSARDALERFSVTEEADGVNSTASSPTSRTKFWVKKEDDEDYNRCRFPAEDQSFAGLKKAIQLTCASVDIAKENQLIRQEICDSNGKIVSLLNVTSDADVEEMFQSAEEAGRRVKLIVSNKDKPGAEIPEQYSSTEAMEMESL